MDITALLTIVMFVLVNVGIEKFLNKSNEVQLSELAIRGVWFIGGYYAAPVLTYLING